jgi:DNA repair protein REV1
MLAAAAQATSLSKTGKTLTQANFISRLNPAREDFTEVFVDAPNSPSKRKADSDLDADFLSALPPDLRAEIVAEHKRQKLQVSRLAFTKPKPVPAPRAPPIRRSIKVPRPPCPTFTTQKLSQEPDLRKAMREWVGEFADEGPYPEDVGALVKYLAKVVTEERDLNKAVEMVKWLDWVVSDDEDVKEGKWDDALGRVREGVVCAARERGIGRVVFD